GVRGPTPASGGSPAEWARCGSWTGGRWIARAPVSHGWQPSVKTERGWHQRASSRSVATEPTGRAETVPRPEVRLVAPEASASAFFGGFRRDALDSGDAHSSLGTCTSGRFGLE